MCVPVPGLLHDAQHGGVIDALVWGAECVHHLPEHSFALRLIGLVHAADKVLGDSGQGFAAYGTAMVTTVFSLFATKMTFKSTTPRDIDRVVWERVEVADVAVKERCAQHPRPKFL